MIGEPIIAVIIVTLGLSSMLRGMVFFVASTEVRRFPEDIFPITPFQLGPFLVPQIYAWALAIAALAVLVLTGFFRFSRQGIALRAKTEKLKALRLARDAAEQAAAPAAAPAKKKKAAKQDKGNLSDWLKDREGSGHNN